MLNVWDFGGQEIYHATHQFFLTKRSLYVLLDDTRTDHKSVHDEGFKYWLEIVDLLGDHSPVLIFQNEKSDRSKTIDLAGIKGRFDNVKELEGYRVTDRIRDIDRCRTGLDHRFNHFRKKIEAGTDLILTGEFDVGRIRRGMPDRLDRCFLDLVRCHLQLTFHMNIGRRDKCVNTTTVAGILECLPGAIDVFDIRPAQTGYFRALDRLGYSPGPGKQFQRSSPVAARRFPGNRQVPLV